MFKHELSDISRKAAGFKTHDVDAKIWTQVQDALRSYASDGYYGCDISIKAICQRLPISVDYEKAAEAVMKEAREEGIRAGAYTGPMGIMIHFSWS